jgi:Flp pilus assembly pilin Flp
MQTLSRFAECESGATAIEYALIGVIIGVGLVVALGNLRDAINTLLDFGDEFGVPS